MTDPAVLAEAVAIDPVLGSELDQKGYTGEKSKEAIQADLSTKTGEKGWYACPGYDYRNGFVFFATKKEMPTDLNTLLPGKASVDNVDAIATAWIAAVP